MRDVEWVLYICVCVYSVHRECGESVVIASLCEKFGWIALGYIVGAFVQLNISCFSSISPNVFGISSSSTVEFLNLSSLCYENKWLYSVSKVTKFKDIHEGTQYLCTSMTIFVQYKKLVVTYLDPVITNSRRTKLWFRFVCFFYA